MRRAVVDHFHAHVRRVDGSNAGMARCGATIHRSARGVDKEDD
jgi:hypothetical protein